MELKLFEEALQNFCTASIDMKSNEPSFQALYAHYVIKAIEKSKGIKKAIKLVHREGHLYSQALIHLSGGRKDCAIADIIGRRRGGNGFFDRRPWELFPDLSVSHFPIDNRHTLTREPSYDINPRDTEENIILDSVMNWLLTQSIVTEFKATGSTGDPTPIGDIKKDIAKLALFTSAYKTSIKNIREINEYGNFKYDMNTCMVILDNHEDGLEGDPQYRAWGGRMNNLLEIQDDWPEAIEDNPPIIYVLLKWEGVAKVDKYVNWKLV